MKGAADELVAVVIPPGKNLVNITEILDAAGVTPRAAVLMKAGDPAFAAELGLPGATLEGYLFPDTYKLGPHTPAARALIPMVRRHRQVFAELKATHAQNVAELKKTLGFDDARIVTLASIVEKETGRGEERPRIAQVFMNRLRFPTFSPKLLQADPHHHLWLHGGDAALGRLLEMGRPHPPHPAGRPGQSVQHLHAPGCRPGPSRTRVAPRWRPSWPPTTRHSFISSPRTTARAATTSPRPSPSTTRRS